MCGLLNKLSVIADYLSKGTLKMTKVDRRVLKSQEAIKKAILELMTEKTLMTLQFGIFLIGQMLIEEQSISITWINLTC